MITNIETAKFLINMMDHKSMEVMADLIIQSGKF